MENPKLEKSIFRKILNERYLKNYSKNKNYIKVNNISKKIVSFDTNYNGIKQENKQILINNAIIFYDYFKNLIKDSKKLNYNILKGDGLKNQTESFKKQYENILSKENEIQSYINDLCYECVINGERNFLDSHIKLEFNLNTIDFLIGDVTVQSKIENGVITLNLSNTKETKNLNYLYYKNYISLILGCKNINNLTLLYISYFEMIKNLENLYYDPKRKDFDFRDFLNWIEMGSENNFCIYLKNRNGYERKIKIYKKNRKTHVVEIIAENKEGIKINEYYSEFKKVIQDNENIKNCINNLIKRCY